ncbi:MAG: hypothetical protein EBS06_08705 [Proteobacteria bacterium]|nr:hypothetical protein [Pseudomonadota bacterium]
MLKDIHIQNYRGIKDLKIKDFKRINLLVGDNNSGKTSVLEAIGFGANYDFSCALAFEDFRESGKLSMIKNLQDSKIWNDFEYLFFERDLEKSFKIKSDFIENEEPKTIELKVSFSKEAGNFSEIQTTNRERILIDKNNFNTLIAEYLENSSNKAVLGFSRDGTYNFSSNLCRLFPLSLISSTPAKSSELIELMKKVAQENGEKFFSEIAQKIDPKIKGIKTAGDTILADIGKISVPLKYMGDGLTSVLNILLRMRSNSRNGILLIDEIENGLYWKTQKILWRAVIAAAKESNAQIIATTHSRDTIKALSEVYEEEKSVLGEDEIRLFQLYKNDKNFSETLDSNTIKGMIKNNYELR